MVLQEYKYSFSIYYVYIQINIRNHDILKIYILWKKSKPIKKQFKLGNFKKNSRQRHS